MNTRAADFNDDAGHTAGQQAAATADAEAESAAEARAAFEDSTHEGSPIGEHVMQRLRYFENLTDVQAQHIRVLGDMLMRHGAAVPALPHVAPLKSPIGDHDAN